MSFLVTALSNFLIGLFKSFLGERSRDKANQVSGEIAAEHKIVEAANERAKDAKENITELSGLPDDDIFDRMRDNRERFDVSCKDR